MTETTREHVRQPLRMLGRQVQPRRCSCGELWPCTAVRAIDEAPAGGQPESRSPADPAASALDRISAELRTFGASDEDTRRLVAAVEAALKLADGARVAMSACGVSGPCSCGRHPVAWTLDPAKLREAITAALAGKEAGDERRA